MSRRVFFCGAAAVAYIGKTAVLNSNIGQLTNGAATWAYQVTGATGDVSLSVRDSSDRSYWPDADTAATRMYPDCSRTQSDWAFAQLRRKHRELPAGAPAFAFQPHARQAGLGHGRDDQVVANGDDRSGHCVEEIGARGRWHGGKARVRGLCQRAGSGNIICGGLAIGLGQGLTSRRVHRMEQRSAAAVGIAD